MILINLNQPVQMRVVFTHGIIGILDEWKLGPQGLQWIDEAVLNYFRLEYFWRHSRNQLGEVRPRCRIGPRI